MQTYCNLTLPSCWILACCFFVFLFCFALFCMLQALPKCLTIFLVHSLMYEVIKSHLEFCVNGLCYGVTVTYINNFISRGKLSSVLPAGSVPGYLLVCNFKNNNLENSVLSCTSTWMSCFIAILSPWTTFQKNSFCFSPGAVASLLIL